MNRVLLISSSLLRLTFCAVLVLPFGSLRSVVGGPRSASFTVDTTADAVDASPGNGLCATAAGACTLRAAIQEANALPGADTITLPAGTYTLTRPGADEDAAARGDLDITDNLTLTGAGAPRTTIDGNGGLTRDRVIHIPGSATVTLSGVLLRRGRAPDQDDGGGLQNRGTLTLDNSTFSRNRADSGGGLYTEPGSTTTITNSSIFANMAREDGGGIANFGTLILTNSQISANLAPGYSRFGGGLYNEGSATIVTSTISDNSANGGGGIDNSGTMTLADSILSGNFALRYGGGGILNNGQLTISGSTIAGNMAEDGGGIFQSGSLTITNTRISGNTATGLSGSGGGISNWGSLIIRQSTISDNSAPTGGGINNSDALTVANSTLSGNMADTHGGGLASFPLSNVTLHNVTITLNRADNDDDGIGEGGGLYTDDSFGNLEVMFQNTIMAQNTAANAPDCRGSTTAVESGGYNLMGDGTDCAFTPAPGDQIGTAENPIDPLLGPLANNGGPTWTHALLDGSPAIDTANPAGCTDDLGNLLPTDQRGFDRHVDGDGNGSAICDIGAYEFGAGQ